MSFLSATTRTLRMIFGPDRYAIQAEACRRRDLIQHKIAQTEIQMEKLRLKAQRKMERAEAKLGMLRTEAIDLESLCSRRFGG